MARFWDQIFSLFNLISRYIGYKGYLLTNQLKAESMGFYLWKIN